MQTFLQMKLSYKTLEYFRKDTPILLALSGGQDSLCLLQLLDNYYLQQKKAYAVYIDHQWKNDSIKHTHHIINLTRSRNIPIAIYQIKSLSLSENKARQIRYKTLIQHAQKKNAN